MDVRLVRRIEHYLKRSGVRPTRFGREAARDPRLVFDLRRGRQLRRRTEAKLLAYLEQAERAIGGRP
jgi:hypothetical protein